MPSIPLHTTALSPPSPTTNPLPPLLHTPTGLALLELQGTLRFPPRPASPSTLVGRLVFPLYNPELNGDKDERWMKKVWFYVGEGQRMGGEVKRLARPFAVVRRRGGEGGGGEGEDGDVRMGGVEEGRQVGAEELEIVEVVKYKIVFSSRPEPVGALE